MTKKGSLPRYVTAQELSEDKWISRMGFTLERLVELTESGHLPHCVVDGNRAMYLRVETRDYIHENFVDVFKGFDFPEKLSVFIKPIQASGPVPQCLDLIASDLKEMVFSGSPSCVYFLISEYDEVVYVGQTVNLLGRIGEHTKTKEFHRVLYLPTPKSSLLPVEKEFILKLNPKLNRRYLPCCV